MILQNQNLGQSPNRYHVKPFMQFRYLCFKVLVLIFLDDKTLKRSKNAFKFWKLNRLAFSFSSSVFSLAKLLHLKFLLKITKVSPDKQKCNFSFNLLMVVSALVSFLKVWERKKLKLNWIGLREWSLKSCYDRGFEIKEKFDTKIWLFPYLTEHELERTYREPSFISSFNEI